MKWLDTTVREMKVNCSGRVISIKVIVEMDHSSKTKELLERYKGMVQCKHS